MSLNSNGDDHDGDVAGYPSPLPEPLDVQEFKNRRRLQSILDARDKAQSIRSSAEELVVNNEIRPKGRDILIFRAVEQYLSETWHLLQHHYDETGDRTYLYDWDLGKVSFSTGETIRFEGLSDFRAGQQAYTTSWTETVQWRHGKDIQKRKTEVQTVPADVSERARGAISDFLAQEHGIQLSTDSGEANTADFDYSDLI
jgi:hypothetical protein